MNKTIHQKEYRQIVKNLKIARRKVSLTQKQVAQIIKRPQSYISKVEAGEQRIDIIELKMFANLYKKDINYFVK